MLVLVRTPRSYASKTRVSQPVRKPRSSPVMITCGRRGASGRTADAISSAVRPTVVRFVSGVSTARYGDSPYELLLVAILFEDDVETRDCDRRDARLRVRSELGGDLRGANQRDMHGPQTLTRVRDIRRNSVKCQR